MPNYEINYLHHDGSLACKFEAQCEDDTHAKVLAHAMKDHGHKGMEVWNGTSLVYQRPHSELAPHYAEGDGALR